MSFWSVDDKIPIRQTKVSIPAENGLDYKSGQKINFVVPPTITYFQPKESYLELEVQLANNGDTATSEGGCRLELDPYLGGQVLIRDIRIHSGGAGAVLLEEIQNYNTLVGIKYSYEANDTIRAKRALTEGTIVPSQDSRSPWRGGWEDQNKNHTSNPYSQLYRDADGDPLPIPNDETPGNFEVRDGHDLSTSKVKLCLPLHTGIFSNSKVFPALLTEGLRIEIILEDADRCVKIPDLMNPFKDPCQKIMFHSLTGREDQTATAAGSWTCAQPPPAAPAATDVTNVLYFCRANNIISLDSCPFVVGQRVKLYRFDSTLLTNQALPLIDQPVAYLPTDEKMVIKQIEFTAGTGADNQVGGRYGLLKITLTEDVRNLGTLNNATARGQQVVGDAQWFLVDASVQDIVPDTCIASTQNPFRPNVNITNVNLVLQQIEMPQGYTNKLMSMMKGGGTMNYDFLSNTNYKYSQIRSDRVANIRLPLSESRAKSILSCPTDASVYPASQRCMGSSQEVQIYQPYNGTGDTYPNVGIYDIANPFTYWERMDERDRKGVGFGTSITAGISGIWDELTDYQWFYDGKLNPSRKVECSRLSRRESLDQQPFIELEKALAMAGIEPLSFKDYLRNAVIGRALALQDGCYDCRGRDFNLQLNYQDLAGPQKNKLWHNFVAHLRRIEVKGDQISVQV